MFFVCKLKLCTFSKFQNFKSQVDFTHSPTLCWKHLQRWRDDHLACCCKSSINKKFCIENDFIIVWWHRHRTDLLKQHRKTKVARITLDVLYQGHLNDAFVSWQESRLRSVTTTLAFSLAKTCAIASHHCKAGDQPGRLHDRCLSHLLWQGQAGQSEPLLVGGLDRDPLLVVDKWAENPLQQARQNDLRTGKRRTRGEEGCYLLACIHLVK